MVQEASRVYDETAVSYDLRSKNPYTDILRKRELLLIERHARGRILDAGCGTGFHLRALDNAIGIDSSSEMVRLAKETHLPVKKGDIERLPFRDSSFETVLCLYSVLNVCDWSRAVGELCRVCAPGGRILVSASSLYDKGYRSLREKMGVKPGRYAQTKKFHIMGKKLWMHLFTREELTRAFESNGFSLIEFDSVFRGVRPEWGNWKRFSIWERFQLWLDWKRPPDYGAMYLLAFKKPEGKEQDK